MTLKVYNRKRKFSETPEPPGRESKNKKGPLKFVVQMHDASRLHYDFRIEFGGAYKSWAVPKGPSLNPMDQRLAVFVEDHPIEYGKFEGIIPAGNYGAGTVMVWDTGTYTERGSQTRKDSETAMKRGFAKGHMTFLLEGQKLHGEFALIKLNKTNPSDKAWLLVKKRDAFAAHKDITKQNLSVKTGRSMEKIAEQAQGKGDIWLSKRKQGKSTTVKKGPTKAKAWSKGDGKSSLISRRVKPLIPTAGREAPKGLGWIFESYLDGVRAITELDGRTVHMHSRSLMAFEKKYPDLVKELKTFTNKMVLDGEIVSVGKKNIYHIYDILFFNGKDLRESPLSDRKKILRNAFEETSLIKKVESKDSVLDLPKNADVIAKNSKSIYHSGTSKEWLRIPAQNPTTKGKFGKSSIDEVRLTHLDKIFFPEDKLTKGDLVDYYRSISSFILPHLKDRPESLNRFPSGINQQGFYQKDMTGHLPRFLKTQRIYSESNDKSVDYAVCQDERSLLYLVNLGCIEMNPWFSRIDALDNPDFLVIDLDPDGNAFSQVIQIAKEIHKILDEVGAPNFCKTSGATGIHIGVPTKAKYDFDKVRKFAEEVCQVIAKKHPATTSMERSPNKRRKKIYLDCMQNRRGQTLASAYSVRPHKGAPVSTPLQWKELTPDVKPGQFNIKNTLPRLKKIGDIWKPVLELSTDLEKCSRALKKKYG